VKNAINKFFTEYEGGNQYINISFSNLYTRIIYPIKSIYGDILGISTRTIYQEDTRAKYTHHLINIYNKPINIIYNINNIYNIYTRAYVVEGAGDVWTMYRFGIENAVAILGSSFSDSHYRKLLRAGIKEIVFCFDGDEAGKKALERAINIVDMKSDLKIYVKILPEEEDPDSFLNKYGIDEWNKIEEKKLFKYQLHRFLETEDKNIKESLYRMIISCDDEIQRERMLRALSKAFNIQKTKIITEIEKFESRLGIQKDIPVSKILSEKESLLKDLEKFRSAPGGLEITWA